MADLTIQKVVEAGLKATYAAATAGGDAVLNVRGDVVLHVKNAAAGSKTVTVTAQTTSKAVKGMGSMTKANIVAVIPAGEDWFIGPFSAEAYNDANGKAQITYDDVTSVTIAALEIKRAE